MNIISIDPSLSSTAVVVKYNNEYKYFSFFKNYKPKNKWCVAIDNFVNFTKVELTEIEGFSENEMHKFNQYDHLAATIVSTLFEYLPDSMVKIESYSQESKHGRYQDLVTFGTLLRYYLLKHTSNIKLFTPKEVKKYAAELVYEKDKKGVARNNDGKSGGSFNKWDMYQCLIDSALQSEITTYSKSNEDLIKANKSVPKPLEDLIDAFFLNVI